MSRRIILCSGVTASGKSFWGKYIHQLLDLPPQALIDGDQVRVDHFGRDHVLTDAEHLQKNALIRETIRLRLTHGQLTTVVATLPMLTVENHQRPFVELAGELGAEIKAIWFQCERSVAIRRSIARQADPDTICDVKDQAGYEKCARLFEPPQLYPYITIDTSDESAQADAIIQRTLQNFLMTP